MYKGKRKENSLDIFRDLDKIINKISEKDKLKGDILIKNANISEDELSLAQKLDAIKEYTVERFEENIVVLEDRKTQKMLNIEKNKLPNKIKEGDIIKEINGKFLKDEEKTEEVLERIKNKMDDLWS